MNNQTMPDNTPQNKSFLEKTIERRADRNFEKNEADAETSAFVREQIHTSRAQIKRSLPLLIIGILMTIIILAVLSLAALGLVVGYLDRKEARELVKNNPTASVPANQTPEQRLLPRQLKDFQLPATAPILGNQNAEKTLTLIADFQCPYCKLFHDELYEKIKTEYVNPGKLKFAFLDFAFLGDESKNLAVGGVCSQEQGKFWEYMDYVYKNQGGENTGKNTPEAIIGFAKALGLNTTQFAACQNNPINKAQIEASNTFASNQGIDSTPSFIIGNTVYSGVPDWQLLQDLLNR